MNTLSISSNACNLACMETIHYQLIFGECMAEFIRFDFPIPNDEKVHKIWNEISTLRHDVYAEELQQY